MIAKYGVSCRGSLLQTESMTTGNDITEQCLIKLANKKTLFNIKMIFISNNLLNI